MSCAPIFNCDKLRSGTNVVQLFIKTCDMLRSACGATQNWSQLDFSGITDIELVKSIKLIQKIDTDNWVCTYLLMK